MNAKTFKNYVPEIFRSAEQREKRALERIERQREEREEQRSIALRDASLADAVDAARAQWSDLCAAIDDGCRCPSSAQYAQDFLRGVTLKVIAEDMSAHAALKPHAEAIKDELKILIVHRAEKNLADFRKLNKGILSKLPKLERAAEPPFIAASPVNETDWRPAEPPSVGVRSMLGLRPGELVAPPFVPTRPGQVPGADEDAED